AIVVVDLHGEAVGERLADGERIDRAAVAGKVVAEGDGIDAGGAGGGGDADRQGVGVGGVDVAVGDQTGRRHARGRQAIAFRNVAGLRGAGDLRRVVGAGDGDGDDLGGETAIVVVDLHGEAVGERLADGERIDRAA